MRPSAAACSFSIGWDVGGWNCDKNGKSREGIVNAVAHRDYASRGSVQVMLFADRLEVWNPGLLPSSLTLARLRKPHGSVPHNPLLAEPLYLTQYIERMGTGTGDMIRRCREAGLREPKFEMADGFTITLWRTKGSSVGVKPSGKMSGKIVLLLKEKPDITIPELAGRLRRTERTIERLINRLKSDEIIGRVGPAKGGHWEVLK
jgi:predicted HTH transcriptional regulator